MEVPDWVRTNTAVLSALLRTLGAGDVPRWVCEECCRSSSLFETLERDGLLQRCRPSDVQKVDTLHWLIKGVVVWDCVFRSVIVALNVHCVRI